MRGYNAVIILHTKPSNTVAVIRWEKLPFVCKPANAKVCRAKITQTVLCFQIQIIFSLSPEALLQKL